MNHQHTDDRSPKPTPLEREEPIPMTSDAIREPGTGSTRPRDSRAERATWSVYPELLDDFEQVPIQRTHGSDLDEVDPDPRAPVTWSLETEATPPRPPFRGTEPRRNGEPERRS